MAKAYYKNNPKVRDFDIANYLDSEKAMAEYLNMEFASGDSHYIKLALANIARARNMSKLAKDSGISRTGLYKALSTDGNPEYGTIQKIVNALNLRIMVVPQKNNCRLAASAA